MFTMLATATGEVRDVDGNLIESHLIEARTTITEAEARALGLITEED